MARAQGRPVFFRGKTMIASNQPSGSLSDVPTHDARGKFAPGNRLGRGNPHAQRVNRLRTALLKTVTPEDMREITAKLVELSKAGDLDAAELLLDRVFGRVVARDPELEELMQQAREQMGTR